MRKIVVAIFLAFACTSPAAVDEVVQYADPNEPGPGPSCQGPYLTTYLDAAQDIASAHCFYWEDEPIPPEQCNANVVSLLCRSFLTTVDCSWHMCTPEISFVYDYCIPELIEHGALPNACFDIWFYTP